MTVHVWLTAALVIVTSFSPHRILGAQSWRSGTLYGVTVGENAQLALSRLDVHPPRWNSATATPGGAKPLVEYRLVLADYGKALLALWFDTRIKTIKVYLYGSRQPNITDPYGLRLNDSVARLNKKRGPPDVITANGDRVYGKRRALHWVYGAHNGKITSIEVSEGAP